MNPPVFKIYSFRRSRGVWTLRTSKGFFSYPSLARAWSEAIRSA